MRAVHRRALAGAFVVLASLVSSTTPARTQEAPVTFFWLESTRSHLGVRVTERLHLTEQEGTFEVLPARYGEEVAIGFRDHDGFVYQAHFLLQDPGLTQPGIHHDPECDWVEPTPDATPRFLGLAPDFVNECVAGGYDILEIELDADEQVVAFAADFEYRGAGALGDVRGRIRYRASPELGGLETAEGEETLRCDADPEGCFGPFEEILPAPELWPDALEQELAWGSLGLVWRALLLDPAEHGPWEILETAFDVAAFSPDDPLVLASIAWLTDEVARDPAQARREARGDGTTAERLRAARLSPQQRIAEPRSAASPSGSPPQFSTLPALREALRERASPVASIASGSERFEAVGRQPTAGLGTSSGVPLRHRRDEERTEGTPSVVAGPDIARFPASISEEPRPPGSQRSVASPGAAAMAVPGMTPEIVGPAPAEAPDWLSWIHELAQWIATRWMHFQASLDAWTSAAGRNP